MEVVVQDGPLTAYMKRIFVIVARDEFGREGIVAINNLPLVCSEESAAKNALPDVIKTFGKETTKTLHIAEFERVK